MKRIKTRRMGRWDEKDKDEEDGEVGMKRIKTRRMGRWDEKDKDEEDGEVG